MLVVETIARIRREHFIKSKTIKEIAWDLRVQYMLLHMLLSDTYLTFGLWTSLISIVMWRITLIFSLLGTTAIFSMNCDEASERHLPPRPANDAQPTAMRQTTPQSRYQVFP